MTDPSKDVVVDTRAVVVEKVAVGRCVVLVGAGLGWDFPVVGTALRDFAFDEDEPDKISGILARFDDARFQDLDFFNWTILCIGLDKAHPLHHLHSRFDSSKNCVFAIEPGSRCESDEELAPIRVLSAIRH
jgi:hypothetical protein